MRNLRGKKIRIEKFIQLRASNRQFDLYPKVDKIVARIYVAAAKKEVFGDVGVEGMVAGPSEITVLADKKSEIKSV